MKDYMQFSVYVNLYNESKLQFVVLFECTFCLYWVYGCRRLPYQGHLNLEQERTPPS